MAHETLTKPCIVCGNDSSPAVSSAGTMLTHSRASAGEFLVGFNVINFPAGGVVFEEESLCQSCFQVVTNCDKWNYFLHNGLELLMSKARRGENDDEDDMVQPEVKLEMEVSY